MQINIDIPGCGTWDDIDDILVNKKEGAVDAINKFLVDQVRRSIFQVKGKKGYISYNEASVNQIIENIKEIFETGRNKGVIAKYEIQKNTEPLSKEENFLRPYMPVTRNINVTYMLTPSFFETSYSVYTTRKIQLNLTLNLGQEEWENGGDE